MACLSIPCLGLLFEEANSGSIVLFGLNAGDLGLILAFAILFAMRLIFWQPVPPHLQAAVRWVVSSIFLLSLLWTISWFALVATGAQPAPGIASTCFLFFAGIFAVATVVWLVRYRRE